MLEIRAGQYQKMEQDYRERFHREILGVVRDSFRPEQVGNRTDEELLVRIAAAHTRATGRAIDSRSAVAKFAILDLLAGPQFDTAPPVDAYLKQPKGTPDEKLDALYAQLSKQGKA